MRLVSLLSLTVLCMVQSGWTDLIEVDFGSHVRGATVDTRSGLEWLDIDITAGFSDDQVVSLTQDGKQFAGFSRARFDQLEMFFAHLGLVSNLSTTEPSIRAVVDSSAAKYAHRLIYSGQRGPVGHFDDGGAPSRTGTIGLFCCPIGGGGRSFIEWKMDVNPSFAEDLIEGHWLVREFQGEWDALSPVKPYGDANEDTKFDQHDLIIVLRAGFYGTGEHGASWPTGDFDGDGFFDQRDIVKALQTGGYQVGRLPAYAIPEPSSWVLLVVATLGLIRVRRRRLS